MEHPLIPSNHNAKLWDPSLLDFLKSFGFEGARTEPLALSTNQISHTQKLDFENIIWDGLLIRYKYDFTLWLVMLLVCSIFFASSYYCLFLNSMNWKGILHIGYMHIFLTGCESHTPFSSHIVRGVIHIFVILLDKIIIALNLLEWFCVYICRN